MDSKEVKNVKQYDPNTDSAGYAHVPVGQRVEQVKNGGEGSGNFGHSGRPGEPGGSGEGGGDKDGKLAEADKKIKGGLADIMKMDMHDMKQYNPDTDRPGTAYVPQNQKTEMITNPPYKTPDLGNAPDEMQKEADRIYKDLRKNQYHAETEADRGAAAGTMWTTLKKTWRQDKDGKWVKKEPKEPKE